MSDEIKKEGLTAAQLRLIKVDEFGLIDALDMTQGQVEDWAIASDELLGGQTAGEQPMVVYRRTVVEAAMTANWFVVAPTEFKPSDMRSLRPGVLKALYEKVTALFTTVNEPDENFTEPQ